MADSLIPFGANLTDFMSVFPPEISEGLSFLITLVKISLALILIYVLILIIAKLAGFMRERNLYKNFKKIADNTDQINQRLDFLIKMLSAKYEKEKEKEERLELSESELKSKKKKK